MYKILSLDGGGSWALLQLLTLKERFQEEIPELNGHAILREFDMVIANSGGSIVLAALCENWTIDEALNLFDKKEIRERIFSKNKFNQTFFPVMLTRFISLGPKYSSSKKYKAFRELFPKLDKMTMEKVPEFIQKPSLKIIICSFDALNNRAKFFRSYANNNDILEFVSMTKAIHGSSNAPVQYFDFPAKIKADGSKIWYHLWDGALGGFNNPVVAGVIEAFRNSVDLDKIQLISLGTGNKLISQKEKERFYKVKQITIKERNRKYLFWRYKYQLEYFKKTVMNQAKTILFEPPDWANFVALMFLSKTNKDEINERFIRLSPLIHYDNDETRDSVKSLVDELSNLDMDLTKDDEILKVKECFELWKNGEIANQPIEFSVTRQNKVIFKTGFRSFKDGIKICVESDDLDHQSGHPDHPLVKGIQLPF